MKKILYFIATFVVSASFCGNTLFAQDIIVTKKSEKIEAKITDVEQDCIKYKKYNYQEGPTYTILKADIASIIYQNGDVETFTDQNYQNKTDVNDKLAEGEFIDGYCSHIAILSRSLLGGGTSKYVGYVIGDPIAGLSDIEIENKIRKGELAFFEDRDFRNYLEKYDTEAFRKIKQGHNCTVSAYVLTTIAGIGLCCWMGGILGSSGMEGISKATLWFGVPTLIVGAMSVPLWVSGDKICNRTVPEMYNSRYSQLRNSSPVSLNIGAANGGGLGLSLRF